MEALSRRELMGAWPDRPRAETPSPRVILDVMRAEYEGSWPRERDQRGLDPGTFYFRGKVYDRAPLEAAWAEDRAQRDARARVPDRSWAQELARYGSRDRSDDQVDALALAWQSAPDAWVRRAEAERRAVERTGRVLVAWLIG
jgi:hypothetical protein